MQDFPTFIPVVAVALLRGDGRILMQQRRYGVMHGGLWEFPGGKVNAGEVPEQALVREIEEELGVRLDPASLVPLSFASDPAMPPAPREPYVILLYTCRDWAGEPRCLDGQAIEWFDPVELEELVRQGSKMPPLDVPLARTLLRVI